MIRSSIVEVLPGFLGRHQDIAYVRLFSPKPVPLMQARVKSNADLDKIISSAEELRSTLHLPFWDCVNLSCFEQGQNATPLIKEALFHNDAPADEWLLDVEHLESSKLTELCDSVGSQYLVLSSLLGMKSGEVKHIPMLDFHCPASDENLEMVVECCRLLHSEGGLVVASGKSYHFYGVSLLSQNDMTQLLAQSLLLAPIVDRAWVSHQLQEGACGLRISKRASDAEPPSIVAAF